MGHSVNRRFCVRLVLYVVLVIILQGAVSHWGSASDPFAERIRAAVENADVIFLGDSSLVSYEEGAEDRRPTPDILNENLPELRVENLWFPGNDMRHYLTTCRFIARQPRRPRFVVIALNIRSLSPFWVNHPQIQSGIDKGALALADTARSMWHRPAQVFKAYSSEVPTPGEFEQMTVYDKGEPVGRMGNFYSLNAPFSEDRVAGRLYIAYCLHAEPDNPTLRAAVETVKTLRKAGIIPIVYSTPVDFECIKQLAGQDALDTISTNVALVAKALAAQDVPLLDYTFALNADAFHHPLYVNEHLTAEGRAFVATSLAKRIRELQKPEPPPPGAP